MDGKEQKHHEETSSGDFNKLGRPCDWSYSPFAMAMGSEVPKNLSNRLVNSPNDHALLLKSSSPATTQK